MLGVGVAVGFSACAALFAVVLWRLDRLETYVHNYSRFGAQRKGKRAEHP